MASLSRDSSGNYTIQVVCKDGKRRPVRLGKVNKKTASEVKLKIEHLNASAIMGLPLDTETAQWVTKIGDDLADKLSSVGLIPERKSQRLGEVMQAYVASRWLDSKPATATNVERVVLDLIAFHGSETDIRKITSADAEGFKNHYQQRKLAATTIYRRLKMCKMLFEHARKMGYLTVNPYAETKTRNYNPPERQYYVTDEEATKLIEHASPVWRLIIALARYAGLRTPSETLSLKWEHVSFSTSRITVYSPKTEHLEGGASRVIPMFHKLKPFIDEAYDLAEEGEEFVVGGKTGATYRKSSQGRRGWKSCCLRTTLTKIAHRAGVVMWPRPFHSMRSSFETDLLKDHPIHIAAEWAGNTPRIALGHYLQTLESDFEKAILGGAKSGAETGAVVVQKAVQSASATKRPEVTETQKALENQGFCRVSSVQVECCTNEQMAKVGVEPSDLTSLSHNNLGNSPSEAGAESGAVIENPLLSAILSLAGKLSPAEQEAVMKALGQRTEK